MNDQPICIPPNKSLILDLVTKRYASVTAVDHVSFMAEYREFLAIAGSTGCGKTTLLRLIAGLERADEGHIYIHGRCVDAKGRPIEGFVWSFRIMPSFLICGSLTETDTAT